MGASSGVNVVHTRSLPADYFERKYQASADPWNYLTSPYERAKYGATLAALPRERYRSALEVGCSIGVFTARLAPRCDRLLAIDVSATALNRARDACAAWPRTRFARHRIPTEWPQGRYDLIVIAEIGYYLSATDLVAARERCVATLRPAGDLILVHWTPRIGDAQLSGDCVHDLFRASPHLCPLRAERAASYRLDVLRRAGAEP